MPTCAHHPSALWAVIRKAYEGRDRARQEPGAIAVAALAGAYGVHENSIYLQAGQNGWQRPAWYNPRTLKGRAEARAPQRRRLTLLALLRQASAARKPCPSNVLLAEQLGVSLRQARLMMRELVKSKTIAIEYRNPTIRRVILLPDGSATDWATPARQSHHRAAARPKASVKGRAAKLGPRVGVDLVARDATLFLARRGIEVFDCGILNGRWREKWSIDGKLVDRQGLLAEARA